MTSLNLGMAGLISVAVYWYLWHKYGRRFKRKDKR